MTTRRTQLYDISKQAKNVPMSLLIMKRKEPMLVFKGK